MPTPAPTSSSSPGTKKGLSLPNRIAIGLLAAAALVVGLIILFNTLGEDQDQDQAAGTTPAAEIVREESLRRQVRSVANELTVQSENRDGLKVFYAKAPPISGASAVSRDTACLMCFELFKISK